MNLIQFLAEDNAVVAATVRIVSALREPVKDAPPAQLRRMSGLTDYSWSTHGPAATEWAAQIQEAGGIARLGQ